MDQDQDSDLDTPPPSPKPEIDEVICLSGTADFAAHKPKNNWDSLCGSRSFKIMVHRI